MPESFVLTEAMIHAIADPVVFARGRDYLRQGAVTDLAWSGDRITARVYGSDVTPYRVRVQVGPSGIGEADCSCPYDWGGACKHIVAVLLAALENREAVAESSPLEARLASLNEGALRALLLELADEDPEVARRIERRALARQTKARPETGSALPLDPSPYRRQARAVIRSTRHGRYDDYYESAAEVSSGLFELLEPIPSLLEAGNGRNALLLLEVVTDEFAGGLDELYDHDGDLTTLITSLAEWWAEALLSADLTPDERRAWARKLRKWERQIAASDYDAGLEIAVAAAEQGWDHPPLVRVLQGEITDQGAWDGDAPGYADELAVARLNVLERQGRLQEYLNLAEAEGQTERFLTMLVRVGRVTEAVEKGGEWLAQPQEVLTLAKALHAHGDHEQALQVAERGMELMPPGGVRGGWVAVEDEEELEEEAGEEESPSAALRRRGFVHHTLGWSYHRAELARWLRDTAAALEQPGRALPAALVVMEERPSLVDYKALQAVAREEWQRVRSEVLDRLRAPILATQDAAVDIFLHEGLVDDAIEAVESGHEGHVIVGRVVEAAIQERPEWAMDACFYQAARIIEPGSAQYYAAAAEWLGKAWEAASHGGLLPEWETRMDDIMTRHQRKYKLMPMLKALR